MTQQAANEPVWLEKNFRDFEKRLNGTSQSELHKLRKQAFSALTELGFPTTRNEDWKYTNVAKLLKTPFRLSEPGALNDSAASDVSKHVLFGQCSLVFVNGHFAPELSTENELPQGVHICSLREAFAGKAGAVEQAQAEKHFAQYAQYHQQREQAFVALNTAFVQDGAYIRLEKNVCFETPIELVFLTSANQSELISNLRNLIIAEEGSQATLIETHVAQAEQRSQGESNDRAQYLTSAVTEVVVEQNAKFDHYKLQLESEAAYHISSLYAHQSRDSQFSTSVFTFGGGLVRNEISPVLDGEGIDSTMNGLTVISGDQHVDNHTVIDHAKPHCESKELFKGIYNDSSRGVFCGTIIVRPDAQKTNAIQSNASLLLSNTAHVDSKPQLKIWADDVRCTHGATIGQLDEHALFYLRSRGLDKQTAKNMLIHAFASDVISEVRPELLKERLEQILSARLA